MGLLPPLISYTTDASGFNMLKAQYGSAFFRASFQIGMTVTNEVIAMSNSSIPVYFSLISNEASFNADCVANNYDGGLKAMYCVFLSNEAFDVNYILHEEYGQNHGAFIHLNHEVCTLDISYFMGSKVFLTLEAELSRENSRSILERLDVEKISKIQRI